MEDKENKKRCRETGDRRRGREKEEEMQRNGEKEGMGDNGIEEM